MATILISSKKTLVCKYDFAVDGGLVGTITWPRAFAFGSFVESLEIRGDSLTSAGNTLLAFGTNTNANLFVTGVAFQTLNAQIVYVDAENLTGVESGLELPRMTISVDALTAGTIIFAFDYYELR